MSESDYVSIGKAIAFISVAQHDIEHGISSGSKWISKACEELNQIVCYTIETE